LRALARIHDALTDATAWIATACVAVIAFSYCYEVASRYVFNAPTVWVGAITVYLLLVSVMLMAPLVTRERGHVTVTFLLDRAGPGSARYIAASCIAVSAVVCLVSVWFSTTETNRQFLSGTTMMDSLLVTPKWVLSACIVYGLLSSGVYFLRQISGALAGEIGVSSDPPAE
jgi:TRAP-type C4-dicarboxylate transport system permease small subunit